MLWRSDNIDFTVVWATDSIIGHVISTPYWIIILYLPTLQHTNCKQHVINEWGCHLTRALTPQLFNTAEAIQSQQPLWMKPWIKIRIILWSADSCESTDTDTTGELNYQTPDSPSPKCGESNKPYFSSHEICIECIEYSLETCTCMSGTTKCL